MIIIKEKKIIPVVEQSSLRDRLKLPDKIPPELWEFWCCQKLKLKNKLLIIKIKLEENKKMIRKNKNKIIHLTPKPLSKIFILERGGMPKAGGVRRFFKNVSIAVFIFVIIFGQLFSPNVAQAATYTWTQTNWNSETANATGHPAPGDWTEYSAKDANVTAGTDITLSTTSGSDYDNSDADFNGTHSQTATSSNSVKLATASTPTTLTQTDDTTTVASPGVQGGWKYPDATLPFDTGGSSDTTISGSGDGAGVKIVGAPRTVVYGASSTRSGGNFGGRSGLNSHCTTYSANAPSGAYNVKGFIGASATDEIRDMQTSDTDSDGNTGPYTSANPIYWYNASNQTYTTLASSWSDMLDGSIPNSQQTGTGLSTIYASGDTSSGSYRGNNNCNNWTTNSVSFGWDGISPTGTNSTWIDNGYYALCNAALSIRCIAQVPDGPDGGYLSSGTYISYMDAGASAVNYTWNTFSWDETVPSGGDITVKVKTTATAVAPSFASGTCDGSGSPITLTDSCRNSAHRYIWYQASLTAGTGNTTTPTLDQVQASVDRNAYQSSGTYTSGSIDLGQPSDFSTLNFNKTIPVEITNDFDLLIGSSDGVSYGYKNTGTATSPVWTAESSWNAPDVGAATAPAFADLDNDGDQDVLIGASDGISYGIKNVGTASNPTFGNWSTWNAPDIGTNANPAFADLDNDGDFDLLVGTQAYKNTGTASSPTWTDWDAWDTSYIGSPRPAFADLDNDGDYDLLMGGSNSVYGFKNTGTASNPIWTQWNEWNTPLVGNYQKPTLADLDNDGDYDVLVGAQDGISHAIKNTGTASSPTWTDWDAWNVTNAIVGSYAKPILADLDNENTFKFQIAANNNNSTWNYIGPDGTSGSYFTSTGQTIPSSLDGNRYVRYKLYLATSNTSYTPSLDDITINYNYYPASQTLTSSKYNSSSSANILSQIAWTESLLSGVDVKFQIRTSADGNTWTNWCGPDNGTTGCDTGTYFTNPAGGETVDADMTNGVGDQWFQYKATLTSTGVNTPTLSDVTTTYVVNGAPEVEVTNIVSEDATGKVLVNYRVKDIDNISSTISLQYCTANCGTPGGETWADASTYSAGDYGSQIVSTDWTAYSLTWDAKTDYDNQYNGTNFKVRIKANDSEGANNLGYGSSGTFILDTTNPTGTLVLDASAGTATLTGTDNSAITYLLQNGSSVTSGTSASSGANAWTFGGETNKTVTALLTDAYGNQNSITAVAPALPMSFQVKDITNLPAGVLGEALSWTKVTDISGSTALSYEIWRATDAGAFALLTTIAAANNTYSDLTVLNGHTYTYKVRALDTGGDYSAFSATQSVAPSAVAITSVASGVPTSSSVVITWTTDSFSNSVVQYGTTTSYGSSQTGSDGNTKSHTVTLTGLTSATLYYFKVQSTDGSSNTSIDDNGGAGYPFTTAVAYNITATAGANGTISPSGVTAVETGTNQIYTITPNSGYTIATLTVDGSVIPNAGTYTFTNVLATHTIDVTFSASTYNITATAGENGTISPTGVTAVTSGADQAYTITPDTGYSIATLTVDEISLAPEETYTFANVTDTHTIAVTFTNIPFPTVGFSSAINQEAEDIIIANIPVSISSTYPVNITVDYAVTPGTALGSGVDYTLSSGTLTISAGNTTANIVLAVTDDSIFEQTESLTITLSNPSNATLGLNTINTFSILDNDIVVTHADSAVKATSAIVTWTTGTYANSLVEYGIIDPGNDPAAPTEGAYNLNKLNADLVLDHSIYLGGLTPSTTYYVRTTSTDADSVETIATSTFTTTAGPIISGVSSSGVTDTVAVITWTTDLPATSYVNYSTDTALASPSRFGSGDLVTEHSVNLTGLSSGATYYYSVDGTDAGSNVSEDRNHANNDNYYSFSTGADQTPPEITIGPSVPITTANQAVIIWDTNEDATTQVQYGTATGVYDQSTTKIDIPLKSHLVSIDSLVADITYYYVVVSDDAIGNSTTSSEGTFRTVPSLGGGGGGGGVAQELYDALLAQNKTYKAKFGTDTSVPTVSNIQVSGITPFSATISFETSKDTVAFIDYGKDTSYGLLAADNKWAKVHTIVLNGLSLGTEYNFKINGMDLLNNLGYSENQTFTTKFLAEDLADLQKIDNIEQFQKEIESTIQSILPSLIPPFIDTPTVTDITENSAAINFRTNVKSFPIVEYAIDDSYDATKEDPYDGEVSDVTKKINNHSVVLNNLKPNTKYHVRAKAFSLPQVVGKSADFTFITKASKIQAAIIGVKKDAFTVVWKTDEPTSSIVEYKDIKTGIVNKIVDSAQNSSHSVNITGLTPGTSYEVNVSGIDAKGNTIENSASVKVVTSVDTTPPTISNLKVDSSLIVGLADKVQTIISWQTDEPSTSVVNYAEGSGSANAPLTNKQEKLEFTINHVVILTSLKAGTVYRFAAESTDGAGNTIKPPVRTIVTPQQTASIMDIIFKNFDDTFKFINNIK